MKIISENDERKLVAVLNKNAGAIFFNNQAGIGVTMINESGFAIPCDHYKDLQECLEAGLGDRTPVYEGDQITLQF